MRRGLFLLVSGDAATVGNVAEKYFRGELHLSGGVGVRT